LDVIPAHKQLRVDWRPRLQTSPDFRVCGSFFLSELHVKNISGTDISTRNWSGCFSVLSAHSTPSTLYSPMSRIPSEIRVIGSFTSLIPTLWTLVSSRCSLLTSRQ
ncbi:hypothetical protein T310_8622, partial [Rasamsonia emersonii CBS 393.64]